MFQILPFEPHHISLIGPVSHDWHTVTYLAESPSYAKTLQSMGPSFTAFRCGKAIGAAGLIFIWEGFAQAWAYIGLQRIGHQEFRALRDGLNLLMEEHRLRRVQTEVLTEHEAAHRMIRRLGFKSEAEMPCFGVKGETYTRYAVTRGI